MTGGNYGVGFLKMLHQTFCVTIKQSSLFDKSYYIESRLNKSSFPH